MLWVRLTVCGFWSIGQALMDDVVGAMSLGTAFKPQPMLNKIPLAIFQGG